MEIAVTTVGDQNIAGHKTFTDNTLTINPTNTNEDAIIQLGNTRGVGKSGRIDIHSGAIPTNWDSRIEGWGGNGTNGGGNLNFKTNSLAWNDNMIACFSGLNNNTNGFVTFNGGLTFQWGFVTDQSSDTQTITFNKPFQVACFNVQLTADMEEPMSISVITNTITNTNFKVKKPNRYLYFFWFAVGY